MGKCDGKFKRVGLIAVDRNVETGKLIMGMLEQCSKCKTIQINDDW